MEGKRLYRRRGTPDLPIAVYVGIAGVNMDIYKNADYHPEMEITLQVSGSSTMEIDGLPITYQQGDIFIFPPNTVHKRTGFSEDARIHRIVFLMDAIRMPEGHFFQKEFVQPLIEDRLDLPTLLQPGHPAYEQIYQLLLQSEHCRIYEKNYRQKQFYSLMGICLALMPYCKIKGDVRVIPDPGHDGVKLCMRYMVNHYAERLTLEQLANYCHLHPSYLCVIFKQYTGQTIIDYLTKIRVESAAGLLLREDLPVSKIAELVGFRSECLFYKKFKEIMGMPPKTYQKEQWKQAVKNQ